MHKHPVLRRKRLAVIGGGAAGFFCAVNAARMYTGLEVVLLEKTGKLLSKVRVSGGGRCNLTHACFEIDEMIKNYPRGAHFVRKAFHRFFTTDTIAWFEARGLLLKTESDGRMFPSSNTSQSVIDCLLAEAAAYGVSILLHAEVKALKATGSPGAGAFSLELPGSTHDMLVNGALEADFVCIACGGYPKTNMFNWLLQAGHTIALPLPSLFTFNLPGHTITRLMGVSVEQVKLKMAGTRLETSGPLLITHWGLSGPAVLKLSAWGARNMAAADYVFTVRINWVPGYNEQSLPQVFESLRSDAPAQKISHKNPFGLPQRLWLYFLQESGIADSLRWADLPTASRNALIRLLCAQECRVQGKTTFKEEFVTAGGIRLSEIEPHTMMSRLQPGLFFAGEVLDVDGLTGGFNFQHAWTSGWIAAAAISAMA